MHLEPTDDLWSKYEEQRAFFPLITAPMASKSISEFVCPAEHTAAASDFLGTCEKFLIVGSSGWDTDLFEFLTAALKQPVEMVHLVCPGDVRDIKDRFTAGGSGLRRRKASRAVFSSRERFHRLFERLGNAKLAEWGSLNLEATGPNMSKLFQQTRQYLLTT